MLLAFLLMTQTAPPPPVFGGHLFPAPVLERTTIGRCGKADAVVRIVQRAAAPERAGGQSVTLALGGQAIAGPDSTRLDEAVAKFGAISRVGVYCAAGKPARLEFHGPANELPTEKRLLVDLDDTGLAAIR